MDIGVVVGDGSMPPQADLMGQRAQAQQVGFFVEEESVSERKPLAVVDLGGDVVEAGGMYLTDHSQIPVRVRCLNTNRKAGSEITRKFSWSPRSRLCRLNRVPAAIECARHA
jgi:hypothetical protein